MRPADATTARVLAGGVETVLLAQRAAWLPQAATLLVADVHLGKAAAFRAMGVPVPEATTAATLGRLDALIGALRPATLCVLGDLLHAPASQAPSVIDALAAWRERHAGVRVVLVRGNHDARAGDPPPRCAIDVVDEPWRHAGLSLRHEPPGQGAAADEGYCVAGHLHPVLRLYGRGDALRLPCFWVRERCTVLPAFGDFTGGWAIEASATDRLFVTDDARVHEVPRITKGKRQ